MKKIIFLCCMVFWLSHASGQKNRDAIKIGGGYNLLTLEDVFVPSVYVEYSRLFYEPISLAISTGYSKAEGIELMFEDRELETLHFDFAVYYSFSPEHDVHDVRPGFMLTARSFRTDWTNRDNGESGVDRFFKPGLGFILNYDAHIGDLFLLGFKGSIAAYDKGNVVYFIGGHLGIGF